MRDAVALQRYLQRHTEIGLPAHCFAEPEWQHVLVLPAYREPVTLLTTLERLPAGRGRTLVILVLNRPDSDCDTQANAGLRAGLAQCSRGQRSSVPVHHLNEYTDLYTLDMEVLYGPTPATAGVGLARKTGCDLALQWMTAGGIDTSWLCCTDADATLPTDYFEKLHTAAPEAVAAVFPFRHVPGGDEVCDTATALYELRLHHYVLGLEYTGSPYAYHTLGSCLAVRASAYAHVRGFPKRSAAEDFYILSKLAKLGPVARLRGQCIQLQSRVSSRVPFGTGPAVAAIAAGQADAAALFYHPYGFHTLRALLASLPALAQARHADTARLLIAQGLEQSLARRAQLALQTLGVEQALAHCRQHGKSDAHFQRHFHQWFDGFRTLKFLHTLRAAGCAQQTLRGLDKLEPLLWPNRANFPVGIEPLREAIRQHWHWQ
jgi:hypothetical protein